MGSTGMYGDDDLFWLFRAGRVGKIGFYYWPNKEVELLVMHDSINLLNACFDTTDHKTK